MNFPAVYLLIRNDLQKDRFRFRTFMLRAPRAAHQKTVCLISDGLSDMRKESPAHAAGRAQMCSAFSRRQAITALSGSVALVPIRYETDSAFIAFR